MFCALNAGIFIIHRCRLVIIKELGFSPAFQATEYLGLEVSDFGKSSTTIVLADGMQINPIIFVGWYAHDRFAHSHEHEWNGRTAY